MIRIAINGFGRIGRNFLRCLLRDHKTREKIEIIAINIGPAKRDFTAHMFKYDTLMGTYQGAVSVEGDELVIDNYRIKIIAELNPEKLPWKALSIDWVVDCSGKFTHRSDAEKLLSAGAQYVLISAPAKDEDVAIIPGVNEKTFDGQRHKIVSLGSCTTNAFMTMLKVLDDNFAIQRGFMTTTHAYTNSQVLLDVEDDDLRRSRAAALNIIPTSTGAAKMLGKVLPGLADKIATMAIRVPVAKVSLIELTFLAEKNFSVDAINNAFLAVSKTSMRGILAVTNEPLVSSDFSNDDHSVIIDAPLTQVNGNMAQAFGWYDNEWGYSMRMRDFLYYVAQL